MTNLNKEQIKELLPHREPMLLIDELKNIKKLFDDEYKQDIEYERIVHDRNNSYIHNLIPILFDHTDSLLSSFNDDFACFLQKDLISEF